MFLTGTLLNIATVLAGTLVGVLLGSRLPPRLHGTLTDGLGLFTLVFGMAMGLQILVGQAAQDGDELAVLGAVLLGAAIGERSCGSRTGSRPSAPGSRIGSRAPGGPVASRRPSLPHRSCSASVR